MAELARHKRCFNTPAHGGLLCTSHAESPNTQIYEPEYDENRWQILSENLKPDGRCHHCHTEVADGHLACEEHSDVLSCKAYDDYRATLVLTARAEHIAGRTVPDDADKFKGLSKSEKDERWQRRNMNVILKGGAQTAGHIRVDALYGASMALDIHGVNVGLLSLANQTIIDAVQHSR
jgi:hypothetical protein